MIVMKRIYDILLISALLLAVSACEENDVDKSAPVEDMRVANTLVASIEGDGTRTSLEEISRGLYKPVWNEGDAIGVMIDGDVSPVKYELTEGDGTAYGVFSGMVKGSSYVAYYPYDKNIVLEDDVLYVNLPAEQRYVKESFGENAYPMIAVSSTEELDFMNLCSVLKVSISGSDMVESIVFKANDSDVKVSGNAMVNTSFQDVPELSMTSDASSKVTLVCNGVALKPGEPTDFYIVVPAQTYKGGFSITINAVSGTMVKSTEENVVMERSQLRAVPAFEFKKEGGPDPGTTLEGEGTSSSPFLISSLDNLMLFQSKINAQDGAIKGVPAKTAHYLQTEDISLASVCGEGKGNWTPIGRDGSEELFTGVYDGAGHRITDLYINAPMENYQGLFGHIKGYVCNLSVSGEVIGNCYSGLLVGCCESIENIFVEGSVEGREFVGGIAGESDFISYCGNSAAVKGEYIVGGITGASDTTVDQCVNVGTVYGGSFTGGIVGYHNSGVILNCVNRGTVSGTFNVGGVTGFTRQHAVVVNSLNIGDISGNECVGGIAGFCSNENDFGRAPTAVKNSLNIGEVSADYVSTLGGAVGYNNSLVSNCYWIYDPENAVGLQIGVNTVDDGMEEGNMSLTDAQMKGEDTFVPVYVSGKDSYYDIVDALTAWAADNSDTYEGMCGWVYSAVTGYPEITSVKAEKPSGGETEPVFEVSPSSFDLNGTYSEITVSVTTNQSYYISSLPDWITEISVEETSSGYDHMFAVEANQEPSSRKGTIVFCNELMNCVPVTVVQEAAPAEDEEWMYKDFWHRSFIMKFTGTWCGYCPTMDDAIFSAVSLNPDKFEVAAMHVGDEYEPRNVYDYVNKFSVSNYPSAFEDSRVYVPNYIPSSYTSYLFEELLKEQEDNYPAVTGISFTSSSSGSTVTADVKMYAKKADKYKVTVLLIEDGVTGYQNGGGDAYVHDNVVRLVMSSTSGDTADVAHDNSVWSNTYTGQMPAGCNSSNLRILVYVEKPYGSNSKVQSVPDVEYGNYGGYYVDNSRSEKVGVTAELQFADDQDLGGEGEESEDYSQDGKVTVLQKAAKGNGIDIVLMGDAFNDKLISDGTYDRVMRTAYEKFFEEEPYRTFKDHFNVYSVTAVSKHGFYGGETVFEGYFGGGTHVGGNDQKVFEYAQKAIGNYRLNEALIIVMMNSTAYAGTCWMYYPSGGDCGNGVSVSYFPIGSDDEALAQVLHHEAGGHGFSKLWDEYAYEELGRIPDSEISDNRYLESFGWGKNVDYTSSWTEVKWAHFLEDSRYANEGLGVFEGAATYWTGAYRPTDNSIMRYNYGGFNAPSREAIYYRIHKLAYGESWEYDYEEFVGYDSVNRSGSARTARRANCVDRPSVPTAPPVIVRHSWREASGSTKPSAELRILQEKIKPNK